MTHNEPITFTDAEWDIMLSDPRFGYVCRSTKHRLTDADRAYIDVEGVCPRCEDEYLAAEAADQPVTETTQLSYDPRARRFVGEVSSTNGLGAGGLRLHNPTTGVTVPFVVEREERDAEGELVAWHLRSDSLEVRTVTLTLFND